jgi:hypothetical protein
MVNLNEKKANSHHTGFQTCPIRRRTQSGFGCFGGTVVQRSPFGNYYFILKKFLLKKN